MLKNHDFDNGGSERTAFVFITHLLTRRILREYRNLHASIAGLGDAWLLYQGEAGSRIQKLKIDNLETVNRAELAALHYRMPSDWILPGSSHFPLLCFFQRHSDFRYYWLIEYDVRFSGNWRTFFQEFESIPADFLAAHLRRYHQEPEWPFWELTHPGQSIPLEERLRCFHPICRFSNAALARVDQAHRDGWCGHDELLPPTILHQDGFSIVDFGGEGEFTPAALRNRFYSSSTPNPKGLLNSGTFRFRPAFVRAGRERGKLYHPVKPLLSLWKDRLRVFLVRVFGKPLAGKLIDSATIILRKTAKQNRTF